MNENYTLIIKSWARKNNVEITTAFLCQVFEKTYDEMTQVEFIKLLEEMKP
jgi:hypothetical protein